MSKILAAASAAALMVLASQAARADEAGAVTGGVVGAVGGAAVGGFGGAAVGNAMTNHRHYYYRRYGYYPHHRHYYNYSR